jgi:hypothetical protein
MRQRTRSSFPSRGLSGAYAGIFCSSTRCPLETGLWKTKQPEDETVLRRDLLNPTGSLGPPPLRLFLVRIVT